MPALNVLGEKEAPIMWSSIGAQDGACKNGVKSRVIRETEGNIDAFLYASSWQQTNCINTLRLYSRVVHLSHSHFDDKSLETNGFNQLANVAI